MLTKIMEKTYYITILSSTERDKKGLDVNWLYGIYNSEQEAKRIWKSEKPDFDFLPCTIKIRTDKPFSSDEKFFEEFMKKYLPEQYEKEKISKMTPYERGKYFVKKSFEKIMESERIKNAEKEITKKDL